MLQKLLHVYIIILIVCSTKLIFLIIVVIIETVRQVRFTMFVSLTPLDTRQDFVPLSKLVDKGWLNSSILANRGTIGSELTICLHSTRL